MKDLTPKMTYRVASCLVVTSIIACTISFVSLYIALPVLKEGCKINYDYMGVIVGVLSLLVTILITWQIWQTIDMRSKIDTIDDKLKESRKDYDHEISGGLYHIYALNYINQKQYNNALSCLINGIKEQNKSNNPVYLKNIIRLIYEQFDYFKLSSVQKKSEFISLLEQTECMDIDTNEYRLQILDKLKNNEQESN